MIPLNPPGSGGIGGGITSAWKFDTGVADADPGSKKFRVNNADQTLATFIYVNDINNSGVDTGAILALLKSGDEIYIQQLDDSTRAQLYNVSGSSVDGGGYWKIPVTHSSEGDFPLVGSQDCGWVMYASGGSGINAVEDDPLPKLGNFLNTNAFAINASVKSIIAAATLPVDNNANYYDVGGATDISALTDIAVGAVRTCRFTNYPSLLHGVSLFTQTGLDIQINASDIVEFKQITTGPAIWRVNTVSRALGAPLRDTNMTNLILPIWQLNNPQVVGDTILSTVDNDVYFECSTAGTTNGIGEPVWNTGSQSGTIDGTVTWIAKRFQWGKLYNVTLTSRLATIEVEELGSGGTPITPARGTELFIQVTNASNKVLVVKGFDTQTIAEAVSYAMVENHNITLKINDTDTNSDMISSHGVVTVEATSDNGQNVTADTERLVYTDDVSDQFGCMVDSEYVAKRREWVGVHVSCDTDDTQRTRVIAYKNGGAASRFGCNKDDVSNTATQLSTIIFADVGDIISIRMNDDAQRSTVKTRNWVKYIGLGNG